MSSAHSPSFPLLHLHHSSFSNPSLALPMSQFILQPFCCFTYITAHYPTLLSLLLRHRIFTYVTWRAAHAINAEYYSNILLGQVKDKIWISFKTMQGQEAKVGPPYSPDIAKLEGVQFEDNNTVTSYVQEWVCTESKKLLEKGMKQLQKW